jgi:hypothetical protein
MRVVNMSDIDELNKLSIAEKLMLLVLYVNGGKMEWEKLKWATFFLLKAYEEGVITLEGGKDGD